MMKRLTIRVLAVALLVLMMTIVIQVTASALDINPIVRFGSELPVLGRALTLNSLLDFQWHLLVMAGLLPAGIVWLSNDHIRVDFLYQTRTKRYRARTDLTGNIIFAAPFLALVIPASLDFLRRAWVADEGARNGGLNDLWLIKAVMPLGLTLLAVAILIETLRLIRRAR